MSAPATRQIRLSERRLLRTETVNVTQATDEPAFTVSYSTKLPIVVDTPGRYLVKVWQEQDLSVTVETTSLDRVRSVDVLDRATMLEELIKEQVDIVRDLNPQTSQSRNLIQIFTSCQRLLGIALTPGIGDNAAHRIMDQVSAIVGIHGT